MADKIARALNFLGADRDLLDADADALLDVIDDYFGEDGTDLEPTDDPASTEDPIPMDADGEDTDEEEETEEEEPPTAAEVVQAGLQRGDLSDENITIDR